jgi:hypothetical protein
VLSEHRGARPGFPRCSENTLREATQATRIPFQSLFHRHDASRWSRP